MQHHYAPIVYLDRISYILHSWGLEVLELSRLSIISRVLAKQAAMKARKVIVDAKCMKKIWTSIGIPKNKVEVIPFGVDTRLFNPTAIGNGIRKRLGIKENDITIISTRPFFDHYNIECLIKAIPIVVKAHKNVVFVIKGKGPLESNIKNLAQKLGVDQYIRFTSPVPYHEIAQYLTAANIYVSTSYVDTTSVSLLEAMACGLPPITTDIPGNREWIKNEVNGLLYPPKDHRALGERMMQLLENEDLRKHFTERSLRVIEERATWEKCVSNMEAIYQSII